MRASVSWYSGCSFIAQLPPRERDEDIIERRVVRGEERQLGALAFEESQERRNRAVHVRHGERDSIWARPDALHARQAVEPRRRAAVTQRELDDLVRSQRGDQLCGAPERDDLAVVHDRDTVAQALRFLHVMRREEDGSASGLEPPNDLPQLAA